MKSIVNVNYGWMLTTGLRYARRQVIILTAIKKSKIVERMDELITIIKDSSTTDNAEERIMQEFGVEKIVAREILDYDLRELLCLDVDSRLQYFSRAANSLAPLEKEFYNI